MASSSLSMTQSSFLPDDNGTTPTTPTPTLLQVADTTTTIKTLLSSVAVASSSSSSSGRDHGDNSIPAPFDESTYVVTQLILRVVLLPALGAMGTVTNVLNLVVFHRQGVLTDSSTATLSVLAVSDFCTCLFGAWIGICFGFHLLTDNSRLSWDFFPVLFATAVGPKVIFVQITCWITAYLAFERFVAVVFPFKVKSIFSAKVSLAVVVSIFVGTIILYIPNTFRHLPAWRIVGPDNITQFTFVNNPAFSPFKETFIIMNPLVLHVLAVVLVLFFNVMIFWKVYLSKKFRQSSSAAATTATTTATTAATTTTTTTTTTAATSTKKQDMKLSTDKTNGNNNTTNSGRTISGNSSTTTKKTKSRDDVLLRMISIICFVFLLGQLPDATLVLMFFSGTGLGDRIHEYTHETLYATVQVLEVINASTNIFIYYSTSTRYRTDFKRIFCNGKAGKGKGKGKGSGGGS